MLCGERRLWFGPGYGFHHVICYGFDASFAVLLPLHVSQFAPALRSSPAPGSAGVIAFNWAVSAAAGPLPRLLHHNVFLSGDYEASWRRARAPEELVANPNFYLHVGAPALGCAWEPGGAGPGACRVCCACGQPQLPLALPLRARLGKFLAAGAPKL
jgi:hypothetical protein